MNPMVDGWMSDDRFHNGVFPRTYAGDVHKQERPRKSEANWAARRLPIQSILTGHPMDEEHPDMLATLAALLAAAGPSLPAVPAVSTATANPSGPLAYPPARRGDQVDDYFGTKVADPYRWLEDDNAEETKAWVKAQVQFTDSWFSAVPTRPAIRERLTRLWNYERFSVPSKKGKRYFYSHNSGLQPQAVLYVTDDPMREGRVLLDPNTLSKDGTVALAGSAVTDDGTLVAYAISDAGSDWITWRVREVATGKDRADEIRWSKWSGASWRKDGGGFYYSRFDAPEPGQELTASTKNQKLFFHRLGTPQDQDELIYARPDQPEWGISGDVTDDGRWLVISTSHGTRPETAIYLLDLSRKGASIEPLLDKMDASYEVVNCEGDTFFVLTDKDAPRKRLVAIHRGQAEATAWKELISEAPGTDVLEQVTLVGERFVATWMRDARSAVTVHDLAGKKVTDLALPSVGSVGGFGGKRTDLETFYIFTGFLAPPTIYRLDLKTLASGVLRKPALAFDDAAYQAEQVFYPSKDGTRIPMFLVHRKGLVLDGKNPTLLYGYGGFDISLTPWFSISTAAWLELGGVYAVANLRGGGEYGKAWYDAGRLEKKQHVFDDFIAAAEWLIDRGYTSAPRLAIEGGSNGGLLVGACLTQRPDLFGAAILEMGVLDMLRFHRFTGGFAWTSDYTSSETSEGFEVVIKYSPLQNVKPGTHYPPTLVITADHDDRVVPAHSFKFAAALQAAQAGPAPILARIETRAGHGAGKSTQQAIEERADVLAFLVRIFGLALPEGYAGAARERRPSEAR